MPPRFSRRRLVVALLVAAGAGFLALPAEAGTARAPGRGRPAAVRRHRRLGRPTARRRPRPGARGYRRRIGIPRERAIAGRSPGPDAVDAGDATRLRRLGCLRSPAERRCRRRLPAPSHRRVRDRSRGGRLQRRAWAPCGGTTAFRRTRRRARTCGPFSAEAGRRLVVDR